FLSGRHISADRLVSLRPAISSSTSARPQISRGLATMVHSKSMGASAAESALQQFGLEVELVPCMSDNYCPLIHHAASGATIVVDTPDADAIKQALKRRGWTPTHILNTHHHDDHVGGNLALKAAFPDVKIVGPKEQAFNYPGPYPPKGLEREVIPGLDRAVSEGDVVLCGALRGRVLEVGGHTAGHIVYFFEE
ncbi:unnamed protein product, partial [Polarella glacialis]